MSSLAPPQAGDIASPVCGGGASGRARYVVRGVCVLVVRVAFQCVYLCLRACACLMLRRGVVAVRIWPESC